MQSHIAPLTWEYFARNRWKLLLPLMANIPASLILLPFAGIESEVAVKELVPIQIVLTLSLALIVGFCVQASQGSLSRFYLKPISTIQLVSFYYWTGALLVATTVATLLALWQWIVPLGFPIAGAVLFAVVCWCSFQPIARGVLNSLGWIALVFVLLPCLIIWYLQHFGIPLKRGGMMDSRIHQWTSLSLADSLFACLVIAVSFALTLRRVSQDRCRTEQYDWLFVEKFSQFVERLLGRLFGTQKHFDTPSHALHWFDFKYRCSLIPKTTSINVLAMWLIFILNTITAMKLSNTLVLVTLATYTVAFIQPSIALVLSIIVYFGKSLRILNPLESRSNDNPFGIDPYLFRLPVQSKVIAQTMLRSSCLASIMGFAVLLSSFTLAGLLGQLFNIPLADKMNLEIPYWEFCLVASTASSIATFACSFLGISFVPLLLRVELWIGPITVLAVLLFFHTPIAFTLACFCFVLVLCMLVFATIQSLLDKDLPPRAAVVIWLLGIALAILAQRATQAAWSSVPSMLAGAILGLAMLPLFSTAANLRQARTK